VPGTDRVSRVQYGVRSAAPEFPGALPAVWHVPPRNPNFTGRAETLARLHESVWSGGAVAVHGLGGVGKSELVAEAAYGPHHPAVTVRLENLAAVLRALNLPHEAEPLEQRAKPHRDRVNPGADAPEASY
jgi:hypothetical protein